MNWFRSLKGKVKLNEPLKNHTTFKIGGRAKFFIEPKDVNDLKVLLNLVRRYKIPLLVIGGGSNILISDEGVDGVVLRLNSPYFRKITFKKENLIVGAGVMLNQVVRFSREHGLAGVEFLAGIPGTVGGAVVMNAGISEKIKNQQPEGFREAQSKIKNIGDLVENVTVMDYDGNIKTFNKKDIRFGYRESNLSKYIVLSTHIKLVKGNKEQIKNKIKKYIDYRKATQDLSRPSAGCIFKNPPGYSAGKLIDLCSLKDKRIKNACVSKNHANFILNLGNAKARDVFRLMDLIKKKVKNKFNITLKPEIKIWQKPI